MTTVEDARGSEVVLKDFEDDEGDTICETQTNVDTQNFL